MSKPFDPNNKTCKEKGCVRLIGNHCHARDNGKFLLFEGREYPECEFFEARKKPSLFDLITTSPEVLAPHFVFLKALFVTNINPQQQWISTLTEEVYPTKAEAIAATVERLKEVCDA